jgi:hypothetical protein
LPKNGATPNFVEFKDENQNVVASISTSGDLNVTGSISVNGEQFSGGLGYVIGTQLGSSFDPESGWSFETSSAGAFAAGDYVRVVEDSQNYISGFITQVVFSSGSYYISVNPISTLGDPGFFPSFSIHLEGLPGSNGDIGPDGPQGDPTLSVIAAKTEAYTVTTGDESDLIQVNGTFPVSIPTDETFDFAIGTQINLLNIGTGTIGVVAVTPGTTAVNGTPGLTLRAQWSAATLIKRAPNAWVVVGDLRA